MPSFANPGRAAFTTLLVWMPALSSTTTRGTSATGNRSREHDLGPLDLRRVLLVADGLGGAAIAGLQEGQVAAGLAVADADLGAEGVGQLPGGPGPLLAEQLRELARHSYSAGVVRVGTGL